MGVQARSADIRIAGQAFLRGGCAAQQERFIFIVTVVLLPGIVFFTVMPSFGGPPAIEDSPIVDLDYRWPSEWVWKRSHVSRAGCSAAWPTRAGTANNPRFQTETRPDTGRCGINPKTGARIGGRFRTPPRTPDFTGNAAWTYGNSRARFAPLRHSDRPELSPGSPRNAIRAKSPGTAQPP